MTDLFPSISLNDFFSVKEQIMPPLEASTFVETALTEKPAISFPLANLIKTQIFSC